MEISQIQYINAVYKYGNFSKAAEHLYITQPTLSQQIKKLEDEIGFSLFIRTTRTVALTEEGKTFLQYATPLLTAYDILLQEMDQLRNRQDKVLQFGILPTFSHLNILDAIHRFQSQNQNISIHVQIQKSNRLIDSLLSGQIDAAIANLTRNCLESFDQSFDIRIFSRDRIHVLINSSHPLSSKPVIGITELANESLIMLDKDSSIRNQIENAFKQVGIIPTITYDCPEIHSLIGMLQSGVGVSFLSSRVAQQYIKPPILSIPLSPVIETQTAVIYSKRNRKADILKNFADYFEREVLH